MNQGERMIKMPNEKLRKNLEHDFENFKVFGEACQKRIEEQGEPLYRESNHNEKPYCRMFNETSLRAIGLIGRGVEDFCPYMTNVNIEPRFDAAVCDRRPMCSWPMKFSDNESSSS